MSPENEFPICRKQNMNYSIHVSSTQGRRKVYADSWFVSAGLRRIPSDMHHEAAAADSRETILIAVCDGVGDNLKGQSAARAAIEGIRRFWSEANDRDTIPLDRLALQLANAGRAELSGRQETTLSLVLVRDLNYCSLNVGDSPVFFISDLGSRELSRRHNLYFDKIRYGFHARDPEKDILMANLRSGIPEDVAYLKLGRFNAPGDGLLVCSDGIGLDSAPSSRTCRDIPALVSTGAQRTNDNTTAIRIMVEKANPKTQLVSYSIQEI